MSVQARAGATPSTGSSRELASAPQLVPPHPTAALPPSDTSSRNSAVAAGVRSAEPPRPTRSANREGTGAAGPPAKGARGASSTRTSSPAPAVRAPAPVVASEMDSCGTAEVTAGGEGATVPGEVDSTTAPPLPAGARVEPLYTVHVVAPSKAQEV